MLIAIDAPIQTIPSSMDIDYSKNNDYGHDEKYCPPEPKSGDDPASKETALEFKTQLRLR